MHRVCLLISRFLLSAWVGAAALFVVNGVQLARSPAFDSAARERIALVRFPAFYLFGFVCVGASLLCAVGAHYAESGPRRRIRIAILLVTIALLVMAADYVCVYRPLEAMVTAPGHSRPPEFAGYHRASGVINAAHVGLCFAAAMALCRPQRDAKQTGQSQVQAPVTE